MQEAPAYKIRLERKAMAEEREEHEEQEDRCFLHWHLALLPAPLLRSSPALCMIAVGEERLTMWIDLQLGEIVPQPDNLCPPFSACASTTCSADR